MNSNLLTHSNKNRSGNLEALATCIEQHQQHVLFVKLTPCKAIFTLRRVAHGLKCNSHQYWQACCFESSFFLVQISEASLCFEF